MADRFLERSVDEYAKEHPESNIIAFNGGSYEFEGPIFVRDLYLSSDAESSNQPGNLNGHTVNGAGIVVRAKGSEDHCRSGWTSFWMGKRFKLVAFQSGNFHHFGDGGFINWRFRGTILLRAEQILSFGLAYFRQFVLCESSKPILLLVTIRSQDLNNNCEQFP